MPIPELPFQHPLLHTPAIWHPAAPRQAWVRVRFRRTFQLDAPVASARLWFSGSMRVELELDGRLISRGPVRSDRYRWDAILIELGRLEAGQHELLARVSHFGESPQVACAQMGPPAFFLCCAEGELHQHVATGADWQTQHDVSFGNTGACAGAGMGRYFPMGFGEQIDGGPADAAELPWVASLILTQEPADLWGNLPLQTRFRQAVLPPMTEQPRRWQRLALAPDDLRSDAERWAQGSQTLTIPPRRQVQLVLDVGDLVNAWPRLTWNEGADATVEATWAEAPYREQRVKARRDQVDGCQFPGFRDVVRGGGSSERVWTTAWLRSFRYLRLEITTNTAPLRLGPISLRESSFPMQPPSDIQLDGPTSADWQRLFQACWRTIHNCANEAIWDCPTWEQCQFPGDARFQVLWHYALCGEDRLARKAIDDFHGSRLPDGMLQCRWPSNLDQILPTYGLHWVLMLEEFVRWRGDTGFIGGYLHVARELVTWFLDRQRADGLIGHIDYAPFIDWAEAFAPYGNAPQGPDGGSAVISAMVAQSCAVLAKLEQICGWPELAPRWHNAHQRLVQALRDRCWVAQRGLLAEMPGADAFSLHTQIEAAFADTWEPARALEIIDRAFDANGVSQPGTMFYLGQLQMAYRRLGAGGRIHAQIPRWIHTLDRTGLFTLPETLAANSRSDCHAWSATPGLELATAVFGIEPSPDAIGADKLLWRPNLGQLEHASVTLPHPRGALRVELERNKEKVTGTIESPVPVIVNDQCLPAGHHRREF